jgi:hypothetical protein
VEPLFFCLCASGRFILTSLRFRIPDNEHKEFDIARTIVQWVKLLLRPGIFTVQYKSSGYTEAISIGDDLSWGISIHALQHGIRLWVYKYDKEANTEIMPRSWLYAIDGSDKEGYFSSCKDIERAILEALMEKGYMSALSVLVKAVDEEGK